MHVTCDDLLLHSLDLVKETVSSSELVLELLGLLKRFHTSQEICRGALVPLGFLVTDGASLSRSLSCSNPA